MDKALTIVVPSYNAEEYLGTCLASIVESTALDDLDVVVVDDGSSDGTYAIAQRFAEEHPSSIRAFRKANGGHGSVINFGLARAQGAYFKVLDADDWVDGEALAGLVEVLRNVDADVVVSDYTCVEDGSFRVLERRRAARDASHYGSSHGFDVLAHEEIMKIHSMTVRTRVLADNGIELAEHCFYEDAQYCIFPVPFCTSFYFDDHAVYQYRLGRPGQSVDIEKLQARRDQHMRILESLFAFSDALTADDPHLRRYVDRAIALFVQNQYQIYLSLGFGKGIFAEMRTFDRRLRRDYRSIYDAVTKKSIWIIRKTGYAAFPLGVVAYRLLKA